MVNITFSFIGGLLAGAVCYGEIIGEVPSFYQQNPNAVAEKGERG
jgi:hypothetical protein